MHKSDSPFNRGYGIPMSNCESIRYSRSVKVALYCLAIASFAYWFAAVAIHTHLNETLSAILPSLPLLGHTFRGDYDVAISGIASMLVLLGTVFVLRLPEDIDSAIYDTLLLGSVLTLSYECWVWYYEPL